MPGNGREASWSEGRSLLEAARQLLHYPDGDGIADFLGYVDHDELGLAFDVLVEVGVGQRAAKRFWEAVHHAAQAMGLSAADATHCRSVQTVREWHDRVTVFPCPCCGHLVFDEPPGSDDICHVCFWEDDQVQLRWPDWAGGANRPCLVDSQRNYRQFGAMEPRHTGNVRAPSDDEPIESGWRPIDPAIDSFESRAVQEEPWPADLTALYWWRPSFWRRSPNAT